MQSKKNHDAVFGSHNMSKEKPKNIPASIRARLLEKSRLEKRSFSELLQYFAIERFLYRLSKSKYADRFVLKGALLLWVWNSPTKRPTMDIDVLGMTNNEVADIIQQVREICAIPSEDDGIEFDLESIRGESIVEDADYKGVRILFTGSLDKAVIHMQIDVGFGDVIYPGTQIRALPSVLDFSPPLLTCYSMESVIAEKFRAIIWLGEANSRMKDFYDIWLLSKQFDFDGMKLSEAVYRTLKNRKTELPNPIIAFSDEFIQVKAGQWATYRNKWNLKEAPLYFSEIIKSIDDFLRPIVTSLKSGFNYHGTWKASGPWR
jgi:predicted nucleotidyltransferase component of viral defense system